MGASSAPPSVGRYLLRGELASGAVAAVHLAVDGSAPAGEARPLAVEVLHPELSRDLSLRAEIAAVARIAARVRHANVLTTHEATATPEGFVVAVDYVHGESLELLANTAWEAGETVPLAVCVAIVSDILGGLQAAHETRDGGRALVHGGISPRAVLVGVDGVARVRGFMWSKPAAVRAESSESVATRRLLHLAPELLDGGAPTVPSDVYAAAAVLWQLLAGEPLFAAPSEAALRAAIRRGVTAPPSAANPIVPGAIDDVVLRGLALSPSDRFKSAQEMRVALEGIVNRAPPTLVGGWVTRHAAEALEVRAALVAAIDAEAARAREEEHDEPTPARSRPLFTEAELAKARASSAARDQPREREAPAIAMPSRPLDEDMTPSRPRPAYSAATSNEEVTRQVVVPVKADEVTRELSMPPSSREGTDSSRSEGEAVRAAFDAAREALEAPRSSALTVRRGAEALASGAPSTSLHDAPVAPETARQVAPAVPGASPMTSEREVREVRQEVPAPSVLKGPETARQVVVDGGVPAPSVLKGPETARQVAVDGGAPAPSVPKGPETARQVVVDGGVPAPSVAQGPATARQVATDLGVRASSVVQGPATARQVATDLGVPAPSAAEGPATARQIAVEGEAGGPPLPEVPPPPPKSDRSGAASAAIVAGAGRDGSLGGDDAARGDVLGPGAMRLSAAAHPAARSAAPPVIEQRTIIYDPPPLPPPSFVEGVRPLSRSDAPPSHGPLGEAAPASAPAPVPTPTRPRRRSRITTRTYVAYTLLVIVLGAILLWIFAPSLARAWLVSTAAEHGVALSVERLTMSGRALHLVGVRVEAPEVPGVVLRAGSVDLDLRLLSVERATVRDLDLAIDGSYVDVEDRLERYRSVRATRLDEVLAPVQSVEVVSGRVEWTAPFGEGTSVLVENVVADLTCAGGRALGADYRFAGPLLHLRIGNESIGPWQLDVDRQGAIERAVLRLDPTGGYPATITRVASDDGAARLTLAIPPTALADLHVPAGIFGSRVTTRTKVEARGEVELAPPRGARSMAEARAQRRASGQLTLAGSALSLVPSWPLLDLALELPLNGAVDRPVAVAGTLAVAASQSSGSPAVAMTAAALVGMVDLSGRVLRVSLAGRSGPIPCVSPDVPRGKRVEVPVNGLSTSASFAGDAIGAGELVFEPASLCVPDLTPSTPRPRGK